MKKYFFDYKGGKAVVYLRSKMWGKQEVAQFNFGCDAKEYVDLKNEMLDK